MHGMGGLAHFLRSNRMASFGIVLLGLILIAVLVGPIFYEVSPTRLNILKRLAPPGPDFWLGTDSLGRDVLARLLHGGRVTLVVGCSVVALAFAIGVTIGMISGFAGGWLDWFIMRLADAMLSFPSLVLAIALAAAFGPSLENAMLAVAITLMPQFARVARGQAVSVSVKPYVEAAVTLGLPRGRILLRYVFANGVGPLLVQATLAIAAAIIAEASLSFLGLGQQPPAPSWGSMLNTAQRFLTQAPWMAIWPGAAIFLAVLSFNLLGDGLRDALDPRLRT